MKTASKVLSIILAFMMVLGCVPLTFAQEGSAGETADFISWNVSYNKDEYGLFDTALATITMTNTSEHYLTNVSVLIKTDGLKCSRYTNVLGAIAGGDSRTFTVRFSLSPDASGLNILAKILLKIHEFFSRITGRSSTQNTDVASSFETSVNFGWGGKRNILISADYDVFENQPDNIAAAVDAYNNATAATTEFNGYNYMLLESINKESLQSMIATLRNIFSNGEYDVTSIPGEPPLTSDDIVAASLNSNNGKTDIVLVLKDQEDDFYGNHRNGDSVTKGIGTAGDITKYVEEFGEFTVTPEDASCTYTYPVISVTVDDSTGKIISGNWSYTVTAIIEKAKLTIGNTSIDLDNLEIVLNSIISLNNTR